MAQNMRTEISYSHLEKMILMRVRDPCLFGFVFGASYFSCYNPCMNKVESATKITEKDIENLATLARIKVGDEEKAQLVKEMDSILAYVDTIKKATIKGADVAEERIGAVKNVARADEAHVLSHNDLERILVEIPDREGNFVAVKKIL
jgi:aspartyl/glutamyl-tRNA(Asn/Gln) amidotransferase C subunit